MTNFEQRGLAVIGRLQLVNDPIFIPIEQLEMNKDGQPVEFLDVMREMKAGHTGSITVPRARKAKGKVRARARSGTGYDLGLDGSTWARSRPWADVRLERIKGGIKS